jgi:hypothetical protein
LRPIRIKLNKLVGTKPNDVFHELRCWVDNDVQDVKSCRKP